MQAWVATSDAYRIASIPSLRGVFFVHLGQKPAHGQPTARLRWLARHRRRQGRR